MVGGRQATSPAGWSDRSDRGSAWVIGHGCAAYDAAIQRFTGLLDALCEELPELRRGAQPGIWWRGTVARRMHDAVVPFAAGSFITPMAAVAGAVAEEVLGAMVQASDLDRAYVNNGGDIALHLGEGQCFTVGLVDRPDMSHLIGKTIIAASDTARGVATSGWRGRSFSSALLTRSRFWRELPPRRMPPRPSLRTQSICRIIPPLFVVLPTIFSLTAISARDLLHEMLASCCLPILMSRWNPVQFAQGGWLPQV
jgi:hypothetical protein